VKMKENSKRKHQGQEDTREKELGGEGKDVQTPLISSSGFLPPLSLVLLPQMGGCKS